MLRGEGWVAYITPVLGWPYAIPFEAPIYHWSVALFAWVLPLELSGRVVSALYMLGSVYVGYRFLQLMMPGHSLVAPVFAVVALASPLHFFWGRAFLIESCALFFGLCYLYAAFRHVQTGKATWAVASLAAGALCVLAKATTWPGFAIALGLSALWYGLHSGELRLRRLVAAALVGVIVLWVGLSWTWFSDSLKMHSVLGARLTSESLQRWNFGAPSLRFGKELWAWSLPNRVMPDVFGVLWPVLAVAAAYLLARGSAAAATLFLCFLIDFLAPLMIFTNLHVVHNYYQMSNAVFGSMAAAVCIAALLDRGDRRHVLAGWLLLGLVLMGQGMHFGTTQLGRSFTTNGEDAIVDASRWVKTNSRPDTAMVALGVDWSSIAHYYAERKGIAFPGWASDGEVTSLLVNIEKSLGGLQLGSIIDCRNLTQARYTSVQQKLFDDFISSFRGSGEIIERSFGKCIALVRT